MQADKRISDPWLVTAALVLVLLGLLNLVSTGMTSYAVRHAAFAVVGLVAMWATARVRVSTFGRIGWAVLGLSVLLLAAVPLVGVTTMGAQRWLDFGLFTVQPSELTKLGLVLMPAAVLAAGYSMRRLATVLLAAAVPIALVAIQPDLSTAVVLVATVALMLILARVPLRPMLPLLAIGIVSVPLAVLFLRPYQLERIHVFLSGDGGDPQGSGWASAQADIAVGSGGLWGLGREPRYDLRSGYLPESEHDLAFASLVYGWGLVAGIVVVAAVVVIVWRSTVAARLARSREAALVAAGIGGLFGVQAVASIGASLSVLPQTGMPIPLFSYGGTVGIVSFVAIGLVLAVRRDGVTRQLWATESPRRRRPRGVATGALAVTAALVAMSVSAWQLQTEHGPELRAASDVQMMRCIRLPAERGNILDRNGTPVANNVAEYTVAVVSGMFDTTDATLHDRLAALLAVPPERLTEMLRERGDGLQVVLARIGPDQARAVVDARLPWVLVYPTGRRQYPQGSLLASVLGYVGVADTDDMDRWQNLPLGSRVGKAGLEKQYDAVLRGTDGKQCVYVDPSGNPVATAERVDPVHGHDLRLNLDVGMQQAATDALVEAMKTSGGDVGAAVVMDARTGAVLTLASVPSYDNNVYGPPVDVVALAAQTNTTGPGRMLNHAVQTAAPPGSTFKIVVASSNAQFGVISPDQQLAGGAAYTYGGHTFANWQPMGPNSLLGAIQWSDNVYFYQLGERLGPERMATTARELGVGSPSGIDLPAESPGFLGTPENVGEIGGTWYPGSTLLMGIGQGTVIATPMQVARWTSGIATGAMVVPQLAAGYGPDGSVPLPTAAPTRLSFADLLGPVRAGMRASAAAGTAGQLATLPITAGAKTGTAEDPSAPGKGPNAGLNAWFSAVAPFEAPEIVVTALVRGGGFGSATSGPVVKKVFEYYLAHRGR
ncbi:FtsW/RodA/SpoVE family cell cycle protein [Rhodococcus gannanensis]|uniref:FtsW/RodA/SpoVE family cell cycle protein n=1 Tax=Rhodococcus gannanensis TaxID=1960308 RepID=A0ABW4P0D5_9NOCA